MSEVEPALVPESDAPSAEAWKRFLAVLDTDPDRAGARYEDLRGRLIQIFRWRRLPDAEGLADQTFERAIAKVAGARFSGPSSVDAFVCTIARYVALEAARRAQRTVLVPDVPDSLTADTRAGAANPDQRLSCLARCLDELDRVDRTFLLRYHGRGNEDERRGLAASMGVTLNAMRIRAFRLRRLVALCLRRCLEATHG